MPGVTPSSRALKQTCSRSPQTADGFTRGGGRAGGGLEAVSTPVRETCQMDGLIYLLTAPLLPAALLNPSVLRHRCSLHFHGELGGSETTVKPVGGRVEGAGLTGTEVINQLIGSDELRSLALVDQTWEMSWELRCCRSPTRPGGLVSHTNANVSSLFQRETSACRRQKP